MVAVYQTAYPRGRFEWEHIPLDGFYDLADNDSRWDINLTIRQLDLAA